MLSDNIKVLRKNKGFTQEELAAKLHVVRQTVSKWEKGLSVPDAEMLQRIAEELDTTVAQLLDAQEVTEKDNDQVAEQLARINEQLAIKNRRAKRIWKIITIAVGLYLILWIMTVVGALYFSANPVVTWDVTTLETSAQIETVP